MKKFDPEKELLKVQNNKQSFFNSSKLSNIYVPLLVIACGILSIVGVTFSIKLTTDSVDTYKIKVDILGTENSVYEKNVSEGAFRDTIKTSGTFGSITCTSGNLTYDALTSTLSSVYVNEDTYCILSFVDDGAKNISFNELLKINDNTGVSYYYKGDANNNYIKINDTLFRIVRINGDGSLRLILNDVILSSNYGSNNNYINSNLQATLNNWFNSTFNNESYLKATDFDYTNYDIVDEVDNLINMEGYYVNYVGTLSVKEVSIITKDLTYSYLDTANGILLMNGNGPDNVWTLKKNSLTSSSINDILNVRPVICVDATITSGDGTLEDPYLIS